MSIEELIREAAGRIGAVSTTSRIDANVLATHVFAMNRAALIARGDDTPSAALRLEYQNAVTRRLAGEPVAYITGKREFWSLDLVVNAHTLIPRPETELLVEAALAHIPEDAPARVLDLGTGTGAVALAIATSRPTAQVSACDVSDAAMEIARANAAQHDLERVCFVTSNWFSHIDVGARFNCIVSNPPYIAEDDPHLKQGDVRFEPENALVSGEEGLDDLTTITREAPGYLSEDGWLLTEHGFDQGLSVRALFESAGFADVQTLRDLNHNERITEGRWPS